MSTAETGRSRGALVLLGLWAVAFLVFAGENVANYVIRGQEIEWIEAVGFELVYWVPWVLLTPVLIHVLRRWPVAVGWRERGAHLAASAGISLVQAAAAVALTYWVATRFHAVSAEQVAEFRENVDVGVATLTLTAFWKYWAIAGVYYAFDYYRRYRERELAASRLETRLASARLQALRMQIQPHFLFNTLHSISMLNLTDVEAANRLLAELGDLMRAGLDVPEEQTVSLERELKLIEKYLGIEALRFGDRLEVEWAIDEEALEAAVPTLILQPLVENSIRHGIAPRSSAGRIAIRGSRTNGRLALEVEDDGPGLPEGWDLAADAGVGLANTAERLERLYGDDYALAFQRPEGGGLLVRIELPAEP